jgi:hypothetical protein
MKTDFAEFYSIEKLVDYAGCALPQTAAFEFAPIFFAVLVTVGGHSRRRRSYSYSMIL